ncbi:ParA family protein [Oryzomonas japonica]|uniref:ParA family protein n=1 Tax=Oryzomonas japonica TaxID=2603858 RepID=A0A7J4ZN24_9BACT|nr:AAA family ATPase [Oryzomonas japonica]KAB0663972.1 ParA family protein [Oryzomonas japonica]
MITTQNLIKILKNAGLLYSNRYSFPSLTLNVCHKEFDIDNFDHNLSVISKLTELDTDILSDAISRPLINVQFFSSETDAPTPVDNISDTWLALIAEPYLREKRKIFSDINNDEIRAIHFYGYKGGQARTTTLAITAKRLADRGLRVLVVDADIEAPSLHVFFNSAIPQLSASLMGLCDRVGEINPITAYSGQEGGSVELIGCRPSNTEFDIDFMAFALNTALDPSVLRRAFEKLRNHTANNDLWDIVLVDHRTGVALSVLPIMTAWPGSAVMSLRPDTLSLPATSIAKILFSIYPPFPGAFLSFSIDPEARKEQATGREGQVREAFLEVLAEAIEAGAEVYDEIDPDVLEKSFITWYYDRAMLESELPDYARLSKDNQDSISDLIQILGIDSLKRHTSIRPIQEKSKKAQQRTPSGATDSGWFIETRDISNLMQRSSSISYIFGRKGTGKTRIYREMHIRNFGIPLFAASDYKDGGLRSQSILSQELLKCCKGEFETFWWELLKCAFSADCDPERIEKEIKSSINEYKETAIPVPSSRLSLYSYVKTMYKPVIFLIDGVETAVNSKDTKRFVEALFRFLSTIQNDASLNEKIQFKLLIRPDLSVGIQNVEQQIAGRKVDLRWDEASIFNYMLAEIERNAWFKSNYIEACEKITINNVAVKEARLDREGYEIILHMIFPVKIRRNNLLTMTFLRTYFSDSVSEADKRSSFYPRVIGSFLEFITKICEHNPAEALDGDGRISHSVILAAFENATKGFIDEIKQELYFALNLTDDSDSNQLLVDELILSLAGMQTPFVLDDCIDKLQTKLGTAGVTVKALRDALRQMKDMGMFEIHPSDARKWRVGRLFKEALRMKYVR